MRHPAIAITRIRQDDPLDAVAEIGCFFQALEIHLVLGVEGAAGQAHQSASLPCFTGELLATGSDELPFLFDGERALESPFFRNSFSSVSLPIIFSNSSTRACRTPDSVGSWESLPRMYRSFQW